MGVRQPGSISLPISLAATSVLLLTALLVGWTIVLVEFPQPARLTWLLVIGLVSFAALIAAVVLLGSVLVREIRERRKQIGFLDSVTHELKSPLASLHLGLETLQRPEPTPEQRAEILERMQADIERLGSFIDDVLEASRASQKPGPSAARPVAISELCNRCAAMVARRHGVAPSAIAVDVPGDLSITTDEAALEVVVRNLIDNAVKYSPAPPKVEVKLEESGTKSIRLSVRDEGIGIPQRHLRRIFDRFYRVPEESVRSRRGTGLGLFVVSALVRRLGGRMEAESAGEGRGAKMTITLPLRSAL